MPNYSAQVRLVMVSAVPEDAVVNTFSFSAVDDTDLPDIATALITAYNGFRPNFSNLLAQNGHTLKMYDRADTEPKAPVYDETFNLSAAPTGAPLTPEISLCLSFQADPASGIPQARRRGRVYLGPLASGTMTGSGRPGAELVEDVTDFGQSLLDASFAAADWEWVVWSTTNSAPYIITNGWCDNEYDIQRRRGREATSRDVFS